MPSFRVWWGLMMGNGSSNLSFWKILAVVLKGFGAGSVDITKTLNKYKNPWDQFESNLYSFLYFHYWDCFHLFVSGKHLTKHQIFLKSKELQLPCRWFSSPPCISQKHQQNTKIRSAAPRSLGQVVKKPKPLRFWWLLWRRKYESQKKSPKRVGFCFA